VFARTGLKGPTLGPLRDASLCHVLDVLAAVIALYRSALNELYGRLARFIGLSSSVQLA